MGLVSRTRPRLGDIIEIATPKGLAYAQYTHKHEVRPRYGALIRVAPGLFAKRPADFSWVAQVEPQFITFYPVGAACSRGMVTIVANEPLSPAAQGFPLFRSSIRAPEGRGPWWLWDGSKEWRIGELKHGMERLPLRGVWNHAYLVARIAEEWRHEMDV